MSGLPACACKPRDVVVLAYKCNNSAFNGYRRTPSDYSAVECRTCGRVWRTNAAWVDRAYLSQYGREPGTPTP